MSKKLKTYILIVLVLGIWGVIGYQIYSYLYPNQENFVPTGQKKYEGSIVKAQKDTLQIINYRDPFLGKLISDYKKPKVIKTVVIDFPAITYHGVVNGNNITSYIIMVNNQQELVKVGETFLNVKLVSANTKEIRVEFQRIQKTINLYQ